MILDELDKLEAKATKGPWEFAGDDSRPPDAGNSAECYAPESGKGVIQSWDYEGYSSGLYVREADAALIVALRNSWPLLSKALRAGEAWLEADDLQDVGMTVREITVFREAFRSALAALRGEKA